MQQIDRESECGEQKGTSVAGRGLLLPSRESGGRDLEQSMSSVKIWRKSPGRVETKCGGNGPPCMAEEREWGPEDGQ